MEQIGILAAQLQHTDPEVREQAAEKLLVLARTGMDMTEAVPVLKKALRDLGPIVKHAGDPGLEEGILKSTRGSNTAATAGRILVRQYARNEDWERIERLVQHSDLVVRGWAMLEVIERFKEGKDVAPVVPVFTKALLDRESPIRTNSLKFFLERAKQGMTIPLAYVNHLFLQEDGLNELNAEMAARVLAHYVVIQKDRRLLERIFQSRPQAFMDAKPAFAQTSFQVAMERDDRTFANAVIFEMAKVFGRHGIEEVLHGILGMECWYSWGSEARITLPLVEELQEIVEAEFSDWQRKRPTTHDLQETAARLEVATNVMGLLKDIARWKNKLTKAHDGELLTGETIERPKRPGGMYRMARVR